MATGRARSVAINDVVTPYDATQLSSTFIDFELRHESAEREVVVISILASELKEKVARYETRRVDIATAATLDEKREIFPSPHTYATAAAGSEELLARAVVGALPQFPELMIRARIRGMVRVHVAVSPAGEVTSVSVTKSLPFGADAAVLEAVHRWQFRRGAPVSGDIVFHFEDVSAERFRELTSNSPPSGD
jgi:TonB family protein